MAWYDNELTVKGPHEASEEFLKFAAGESPFDFSRFLPYPEEFQRLDEIAEAWDREHMGNSGGCEWRVENWGTDWLPSRVTVDGPETYDGGKTLHVVFHFDTPENPPMAVIKKAAERYPALRFELRYYECQCVSDGLFCCSGGEVVEDDDDVY